ncbi:PhoH family protein [Corynebacterium jeikeium]|uniref:PhoH family protein n=1 Tax=Corynebacterium jeikeium TaxID=38289 RepID=UPI0001B71AFE|nr:PhoH family protein [Corynebacterium jeikeium]EEW17321.1 PhoH family protein [Corynebacterium jeikeium ATCC 43734]OOD30815.1 ATP-binding protein [Corynebacterium jeikeium]WCZ54068.1 PhoH-like protein [Corynebacterium jeikeium]SQI20405.1 phosphate starvation-inducible protein PhoH [Corynebacterium jeikeium]SUY80626.1 phosphate starvation-inducible protein PhoH [Corynebacterium jeikeium]
MTSAAPTDQAHQNLQAEQALNAHSDAELGLRTYVLDTSVLLSDPWALIKFAEHRIILPVVVISELEGKRHHPELGWFARQALRMLEDFRQEHGRLDMPSIVNEAGGTVQVELNHVDQSVLPTGLRGEQNDHRILACALNLRAEGHNVTLVTKDVPLRVKAGAVGLDADEYHAQDVVLTGYNGMARAEVPSSIIDELYDVGEADISGALTVDGDEVDELPIHCGLQLTAGSQSVLARTMGDGMVRQVPTDLEAFGIRGRSAQQRVALDLLLDNEVGIVSLGGSAGTGKSALALCAGLETVLERGEHKRIVVFRPLYAVGGQDLGYLPGSETEKMNPWAQAVYDTLEGVVSDNVLEEIDARGLLEVLPLTHIRGRSLNDSFVIVDEAQSLERNVLLTVLSRLGRNSRVVLTHDVAQRDNLRVGRHDGIQAVIEKLKNNPLFAHVTLTRSERSAIAELVTNLLEKG